MCSFLKSQKKKRRKKRGIRETNYGYCKQTKNGFLADNETIYKLDNFC